jgi:DNA-binding transcriptional ArsR family regulator
MARREDRREITDVRVLAGLAHPVRVRLLGYLLEMGPRTATQCATVAGASPSACSYHLRRMAELGLVERAAPEPGEPADGRERRWRASATGFRMGGPPSRLGPAGLTAQRTLEAAGVDENARLALEYLAGADSFADEWQDAATMSSYGLAVTSAELRRLLTAVDRVLRPYLGATRDGPPAGAQRVHVTLQAFPRQDPS